MQLQCDVASYVNVDITFSSYVHTLTVCSILLLAIWLVPSLQINCLQFLAHTHVTPFPRRLSLQNMSCPHVIWLQSVGGGGENTGSSDELLTHWLWYTFRAGSRPDLLNTFRAYLNQCIFEQDSDRSHCFPSKRSLVCGDHGKDSLGTRIEESSTLLPCTAVCRCWSRNFAWKVADGVAIHSKL